MIIFILLCLKSIIAQDFICNGDFQYYEVKQRFVSLDGVIFYGSTFSPDLNCWYTKPMYDFEVFNQSYAPYLTKVTELSGYFNQVYSLCQNLKLQISEAYHLSFNHIMPKDVKSSSTFLFFNSVFVKKGISISYLASQTLNYYFIATQKYNEICINGSVQHTTKSLYSLDDYTPLIDNVTLKQLENSTNSSYISSFFNLTNQTKADIVNFTQNRIQVNVELHFQLTSDQIQGFVKLSSVIPISLDLFECLKRETTIYIENQKQENVVYQYEIQTTILTITIFVQRSYNIKNFVLSVPQSFLFQNLQYNLHIFINGKQTTVYFLSKNLISVLKTVEKFSNVILQGVNYSYTFLKAFFLSYFVMNIINFYTLTLMYNFLMLKKQPLFSHNALEKLSKIFFVRNSLIKFIQNLTNSKISILNFEDFVAETEGRERIEKLSDGYSWFGDIGLTYNFFDNNIQSAFLLLFLTLKLLFTYMIGSKLCKTIKLKKQNYFFVFGLQVIILSPTMNTAAIQTILQPGAYNFNQNINFCLHILMLFVVILFCFISFILFHRKRKSYKNSKLVLKRKECRSKKILKSLSQLLSWSLNILIPALVSIGQCTSFFTVITLILMLNLLIFCSRVKKRNWKKDSFTGLKIGIFLVHHICFMLFYITKNAKDSTELLKMWQSCGVIVVFTIVVGGLLQLVQFLFQSLKWLFRIIKKLWKKLINQFKQATVAESKCKKKKDLKVGNKIVKKANDKEKNVVFILVEKIKPNLLKKN